MRIPRSGMRGERSSGRLSRDPVSALELQSPPARRWASGAARVLGPPLWGIMGRGFMDRERGPSPPDGERVLTAYPPSVWEEKGAPARQMPRAIPLRPTESIAVATGRPRTHDPHPSIGLHYTPRTMC